jgi:hypothetical protein
MERKTRQYGQWLKEDPKDELMFTGKMISDDETNWKRLFIVRFSLHSDQIKVWETETDGFRGGFFYVSPHYREPGQFNPSIAFLGSELPINLVKFVLDDAPDSTLNRMESDPERFPFSDLVAIVKHLQGVTSAAKLRPQFEAFDTGKIGRILIKGAYSVLSDPDLGLGLNQHQQRTVVRRYRFYKTDRFLYDDFLTGL